MKSLIKALWTALFLLTATEADMLEQNCLACHKAQQIPSYLIYKRYLQRYSAPEKIEAKIYRYLKKPTRQSSIMPPQFFLKFPMKKPATLDDATLKASVHAFVEHFDVKKRLVLEE